MKINRQLHDIAEEITLLIQYAVGDDDRDKAVALLEKYRANSVALRVLKEFYSFLPEAREEPVLRIAFINMRQGLFLLGVATSLHEYLYYSSEDDAGCLGEYQEDAGDQEILEYFGYADKTAFLALHPKMADLDDFSRKWKVNTELCPVCAVAVGEFHHLGCPVEICPWCHGQLSRCNCRFDQCKKEEFLTDEDLELFEAMLEEKGRICFEIGQGPLYPAAGDGAKIDKK
jgi:hypothetical protein